MNSHLNQLKQQIEPLRQEIIHHPLYSHIHTIEDLKIFMEYHVYAVWDFMSLLKSLQNQLTCTSVPWVPAGNPETRFLINEIVCGEESDVDQNGVRKSHFELYRDAMAQCGADYAAIDSFIASVISKQNIESAFISAGTPEAARTFVNGTFNVIASKNAALQAAVFTFGREDLIPDMFLSMVNDIYQRVPESIAVFKYYLERHIEVDGDHHSHLALQMTEELCGSDEQLWQQAAIAVKQSLQNRITLWNGAMNAIIAAKA